MNRVPEQGRVASAEELEQRKKTVLQASAALDSEILSRTRLSERQAISLGRRYINLRLDQQDLDIKIARARGQQVTPDQERRLGDLQATDDDRKRGDLRRMRQYI